KSTDDQAPERAVSKKFRRSPADANLPPPSVSRLRRRRSYAVISLQTPNPDALRKKSENKRCNLRLKSVADSYARRRTLLSDKFANTPRDQIGLWRVLHVAFGCVPGFGDLCFISRIVAPALHHCFVEVGADIARLEIDNAHSR